MRDLVKWLWCSALLSGVWLSSCTTDVRELTQVMVVVDAEPGIVGRADALRVTVSSRGAAGEVWEQLFQEEVARGGFDWPQEVALVPESGNAGRTFLVRAEALEAGQVVGEARAVSGYVQGQLLSLYLLIEDSCVDVFDQCGEEETCSGGACVSALRDPESLEAYDPGNPPGGVGSHGGEADGGMDASTDASVEPDGGMDGSSDPGDAGSAETGTDSGVPTYTVGGMVTGSTGTVVLQNNGGDDLSVDVSDPDFTFATAIESGESYSVTVSEQPAGQTCTASNNTGLVGSQNITGVLVTCASETRKVSGTVSGLLGSGLVLQVNGADDLPISGDGAFTFAGELAQGSDYTVTVSVQPSAPIQTCSVSAATGTVGEVDVDTVEVVCATEFFDVGGQVSGLAGSGLILRNNGGDDLVVSENGDFAFATPVADGADYVVTIQSQPSSPSQTCVVREATGTVNGGEIFNVTVDCTTDTFTVGGSVSGLLAGGLQLGLNNGAPLAILANELFAFTSQPLPDGSDYGVSVLQQPSNPSQTCTVTQGVGVLAGGNVTDVRVTCVTDTFSVGGSLTGLVGDSVRVKLGLQVATLDADGAYQFPVKLDDESPYSVSVSRQPQSPSQTCMLSNPAGTIDAADVTNVDVTCVTDTFQVGGSISGLWEESIEIELFAEGMSQGIFGLATNGNFLLPPMLDDGSDYEIEIVTEASDAECTLATFMGTLDGEDGSALDIDCRKLVGTLQVNVNGLPASVSIDVDVTGPKNFAAAIQQTTTYGDMPEGVYSVAADSLSEGKGKWVATIDNDMPQVVDGETVVVNVDYVYDCTAATTFTDKTFESLVRAELGLADGVTITCSHMAGLVSLQINNPSRDDPANIEGLEDATNLEQLFLRRTNVSSLAPLAELTKMRELRLDGSEFISDISPLVKLINLTDFWVNGTAINDLAPLEGMTKLKAVDIGGNKGGITGAELAHLPPSVTLLWAFSTSSLTSLSDASHLTRLDSVLLRYTGITSFDGFQSIPAIRNINARWSKISDVSALVANPNFGTGDSLEVNETCLTVADGADLDALRARGVKVTADQPLPQVLPPKCL